MRSYFRQTLLVLYQFSSEYLYLLNLEIKIFLQDIRTITRQGERRVFIKSHLKNS